MTSRVRVSEKTAVSLVGEKALTNEENQQGIEESGEEARG
jgi:hypothetical protein